MKKRGKLSFLLLLFCNALTLLYRLNVKINSDLFSIYSLQTVERGATFIFYAGLNVVVPRVTKLYEKIVQKNCFFFR